MSTETDTNDGSSSTIQSDTRIRKETLLTAYALESGLESREFIAEVVDDHIQKDPFEKSKVERRTTEVGFELDVPLPDDHYQDTMTIQGSDSIYTSDADDFLEGLAESDIDLGEHLELTDETNTSIEHDHSTTTLVKDFVKSVFLGFETPVDSYVDNDGFGALQYKKVGVDEKGNDDEMFAELRGPYSSHIGQQKVLKMQPDREPGDRFETDQNGDPLARQAIQFQFEVEGDNANEVDAMTQAFITELRDELVDCDAIGRIRLTDCQKTVTETGDCHSI